MVLIDEVDDEGRPLRAGEEEGVYERSSSVGRRIRKCCSVWQEWQFSFLIFVTGVFFATICTIGAIVLHSEREARTIKFPECNRLWMWVLLWVVIGAVNCVWYCIEEGFRIPGPFVPDPKSPNGVRELKKEEMNSDAFNYVRYFRLIVHFLITVAFLVVGIDIVRNSTCKGFSDLWLYFKVMFWGLVIVYCILALIVLCMACIACTAIVSMAREKQRPRD